MEHLINQLEKELKEISTEYTVLEQRDNTVKIEILLPQVREFVLWFLEGNCFGISEELYQGISSDLISILNDMMKAMEQKDTVLMHDAVTYGLLEYLQMFTVEEEDASDDNL